MSGATLGTWWRTVKQLHPLQLGARVPHRLVQAFVGVSGVPALAAPSVRRSSLPLEAARGLEAFAAAEATRYQCRLPWLAKNPNLAAYEARYALDLRAGDVEAMRWTDRVSVAPYVASVRARRLASAIARGRSELFPELVRAARAVLVAPEVHLLGNHLLENGIALVAAAAVAAGAEPDLWWRAGSAILDWQLPRQFYADGMHDEGSMTYHLWLVAGLIEAIALAEAAGRGVPAHWVELVERAIGIARDYEAPDGCYPLFNDAAYDAGPSIAHVVELARACGFHLREPRGDWAFTSAVGWVVLRNERAWCVMKAGPDGSATQPGHVHADLLSIELWVDGQKLIRDPGVTSYNDDAERAWCRSSAAHNGPHFEGEDTSEVWSAFRTARRGHAALSHLAGAARNSSVVATRTAVGATFTRHVEVHAEGIAVRDTVRGLRRTQRVRLGLNASYQSGHVHSAQCYVAFDHSDPGSGEWR